MYKLYNGDCLEEMKKIPNGSVDLVLTDPPYGTIKGANLRGWDYATTKWDFTIPIDRMFSEIDRVLRPNGKCILFAQEPFTSRLIVESFLSFCYKGIWLKNKFANIMMCNSAMCNQFEDFLIFKKDKDTMSINPLRNYFRDIMKFANFTSCKSANSILGHTKLEHCFRVDTPQFKICSEESYQELIDVFNIDKMEGFKTYSELKEINKKYESTFNLWEGKGAKSNVLEYKKDSTHYHPTQKPILLLEDLIKTFSNEGDTVLDFTMGSGSTIVACLNTNRNAIGIELDENYFKIAEERINKVKNSIFDL